MKQFSQEKIQNFVYIDHRSEVAIVGNMLGLNVGESVELTGRWTVHGEYGRQFPVETFRPVLPATIAGLEKYPGSGLIQGVGPVTEAATGTTCQGRAGTPAAAAGLKPMDKVISIDGSPVTSSADVSKLIRPRLDQPTAIVVERQGEQVSLTVTPIANQVATYDAQGNPVLDGNGQPAFTRFPTPTANSAPYDLVYDGQYIWFTERQGNRIGRLSPGNGAITEYVIPTANSQPAASSGEVSDSCLLYTSDAADDLLCVDLGGRRIIKKKIIQKKKNKQHTTQITIITLLLATMYLIIITSFTTF